MAYRALQDYKKFFKKGDVVDMNTKSADELLKKKVIVKMSFEETQEFYRSQQ
jgi:hypothetical protein